jgi:mRNA-degrading endonuclease toxin of MazEF toxin-antitoxin module
MTIKPIRSHIYRMKDPEYGTLFCLCITTEHGLFNPDTFKAARVTITREIHDFPGWVRLTSGDPVSGYVDTHDFESVEYDELIEDLGEVCPETDLQVRRTLRRTLWL